jgi:hypothetical protein
MIRITCPNCASKLNAKDELIGQVRNCPKCGTPIQITAEVGDGDSLALAETLPEQHVQPALEGGLVKPDLPKRLNRESCYLICGRTNLVAAWGNKGQGWLVKTEAGLVSAKRNGDQLPAQGDFKLVELRFDMKPEGKRLVGLEIYQLAARWALTVLNQDEDQIMEKVTGRASLNRDQKIAVRQGLKDQFMRPVWENAAAVLEFLANADYHSHSIGTSIPTNQDQPDHQDQQNQLE